jgi:predicted RNA methylase
MYFHKNYLAPYVPSNPLVVEEMLKMAEITPGKDIVYDIGAGDGRIVIRAVQEPYCARFSIGIEIDDYWAQTAMERVKELRLESKIRIINDDVFNCNLREADVVTLYLDPLSNEKIRTKLEKELKKDARIVSNKFEVAGWKPFNVKKIIAPLGDYINLSYPRCLYLYRMDSIWL